MSSQKGSGKFGHNDGVGSRSARLFDSDAIWHKPWVIYLQFLARRDSLERDLMTLALAQPLSQMLCIKRHVSSHSVHKQIKAANTKPCQRAENHGQ
jgi:hypothetical protein